MTSLRASALGVISEVIAGLGEATRLLRIWLAKGCRLLVRKRPINHASQKKMCIRPRVNTNQRDGFVFTTLSQR